MALDSFYTNQYYLQPTQFTTGFGNYGYAGSYSQDAPWLQPTNWNTFGYNSYMPTFGMYNYGLGSTNNALAGGYNNSTFGSLTTKPQMSTTVKGLTEKQVDILVNYYAEKLEFNEKLGQSLAYGAGLGILLPNVGEVTHPISSVNSAFSKKSWTNEIFKDVVTKDIWKDKPGVLQEAYAEMHKAEIRFNKCKAQQIFKRNFTEDEFLKIMNKMDDAIKKCNTDDILKATQQLKQVNSMGQGWISQGWNFVKNKVGGCFGRTPKQLEQLDDVLNKVPDVKSMETLGKMTNVSTYKGALKASVGGKVGIAFAFLGLLAEAKFIKAGFQEDTKTGIIQTLQSVAKAGASWGGYILGDALGKWGGAKLGAMIGSAVCPGLGTAIGAVLGVILGTVCSWGLRKITNFLVGNNVANTSIAKKEINDKDKQAQAIQTCVLEAQKDKNLDPEVAQTILSAQQILLTA